MSAYETHRSNARIGPRAAAFARVVVLLGAIGGVTAARAADSNEPCWSLRESTRERIVIDVRVAAPEIRSAMLGVRAPGFPDIDFEQGIAWPGLRLPVALPPGGDVRIHVQTFGRHPLDVDRDDLKRRIPASGSVDELDDAFARWQFADERGFVASRPPVISDYVRVLPLRVLAVRPLADGRLFAPTDIRITVELSDDEAAPSIPPPQSGESPGPVIAAVVNPEQAREWRAVPHGRLRRSTVDSFGSATSDWLRVEVASRGVYVLTAGDLLAAGVFPAQVPLSSLRLFCAPAGALSDTLDFDLLPAWMEPCSLLVEDDEGDVWDEDTRVYFLGNGPDGWREDLGISFQRPDERWYAHPSSSHFAYWFCWDGEFSTAPQRMAELDASPGGADLQTVAIDRVHAERNGLYDSRPRDRDSEWQLFFQVYIRGGKNGNLRVPLHGQFSGADATLRVSLWGASWANDPGIEYEHYASVFANGDSVGAAAWRDVHQTIVTAPLPSPQADNLITIHAPSVLAGLGSDDEVNNIYAAWAEIDFEKQLVAEDDSLAFFVSAEDAAARAFRVRGLSRGDGWLLLDASAPRAPRVLRPQVSPDQLEYRADFRVAPAGEFAHLVLLRRDAAASPASVTRVTWNHDLQDPPLTEREDPIDYLIIAAPDFLEQAETLANYRRLNYWGPDGATRGGARVAVVDVARIMDEFAFGQHDPTAMRRFLAFAREHWRGAESSPTLTHVILLGTPNYDPRGYITGSLPDALPSRQYYEWNRQLNAAWSPAFFSDDWFACVDGGDDAAPDFAIGRLPAVTGAQADAMVEKIIRYDSAPPSGDWRTRLTLVADDVCQGTHEDELGFTHMEQSELLYRLAFPEDARTRKIYLYEYGHECAYDRKPAATGDLLAAFKAGTLIFDFIGHGSEVQLADERILERSTVQSFENFDRPFFMFTASCAVGKFAHGGDGLALNMMRIARCGALGTVSASSMAASWSNYNLNQDVVQSLFPRGTVLRPVAFGPAIQRAKLIGAETNDTRYNFFGDPASRFVVPGNSIELWLEDVPTVGARSDTLMRGGGATLRGRVRDLEGFPLESFNGTARIWVYDSDVRRNPVPTTPDEDYFLLGARIFSGSASVTNGELQCQFFVPSALHVGELGPARIYAYALEDGAQPQDASGALTNLTIPERVVESPDTSGPAILLRWEHPDRPVEPRSRLMAELEDESGIYVAALTESRSVIVSIAGPDKRILLSADLADSVTFGQDFRTATLGYSIPEGLPAGRPLTLTLEVSDNMGHRSRAAVAFELPGDGATERCLSLVFPLPNPIEDETRFLMELSETADIEISIYTATGRRVRRLFSNAMSPVRALEEGVPWDGRDEEGDPLANGVYFYRVIMQGSTGCRDERIERLAMLR